MAEDTKKQVAKMRLQYPDKLPIFLERYCHSRLPQLGPYKCLASSNCNFASLYRSVRRKFKLGPSQSLYLHVNGRDLVTGDTLISEL